MNIILFLLGITIGLDFLLLLIYKSFSIKPEHKFSFILKQFYNYFSYNDTNCIMIKSKNYLYSMMFRQNTFYTIYVPQLKDEVNNMISSIIYLHEHAHVIDSKKHSKSYKSPNKLFAYSYFFIINTLLIPSMLILTFVKVFIVNNIFKKLFIIFIPIFFLILCMAIKKSIKEFRVIFILNRFFRDNNFNKYIKVNNITLLKQCNSIIIYMLLLLLPICIVI